MLFIIITAIYGGYTALGFVKQTLKILKGQLSRLKTIEKGGDGKKHILDNAIKG